MSNWDFISTSSQPWKEHAFSLFSLGGIKRYQETARFYLLGKDILRPLKINILKQQVIILFPRDDILM